ncbi:MAG: right-handed parallel beta-helix repeat-containing protein [Chloroflexota bacterium]|nr:right-handed parallel beta-helix repeat-containing protein [Chloroflexota bacterium]
MKTHRFFELILILALLATSHGTAGALALHDLDDQTATRPVAQQQGAEEAISVIRQDCGGYGGPYNCYSSLAAWEADYGGVDFGAYAQGDLVAVDQIAVARIEGTWTQPDTEPLNVSGWNTDAAHYITIYTVDEARHDSTPGSGYRLETSDMPIYSNVAHLRIQGLEVYGNSYYDGTLIYLRPDTDEGVGDLRFSHNLIHGNGVNSSSGIYNYTCRGTVRIWNNIIYDVGDPGYTAGIQIDVGSAYIYNNTIVDIISGYAIRAAGTVIVKNNLTEAPGDDFYGSFYPGSDFNASLDDTAPGFNSRREQTFTFVNRAGKDFHLAFADEGASNFGIDLSSDPYITILDDIDGETRSGGWDIGADEEPSSQDSVPPVRLNGSPGGTLPPDTTETAISLATNEAATCRYSVTAQVPYATMTGVFSTTGGLSHTHVITGLEEEQTYTYYVKCQDLSGNANTDDYAISFYVDSSDAIPPVISGVQVVNVTPYSADVTWVTDEASTSQVAYGETGAYGRMTVLSTTRVTSHSVTLVGLAPSTTYHFSARSKDIAYNGTVSSDSVFTTSVLNNFYYVNQRDPQAGDDNPGTGAMPWLTIQHAADVAQPGDTIIVYPGSYGRVTIEEGGSAGNYITFKGVAVPDQSLVNPDELFDPGNPVQVPGNPDVNAVTKGFRLVPAYGSDVTIGYVRIENFEITSIYEEGVVAGRGGILLQETENIQIVRNFIHDINPDPDGYDYVGIRGSGHDNVNILVQDNTLYRVQGTGINLVGRNWIVENNELSHGLDANTDTGLHVGGDSDAMRFFGSGHVIRNNYMHDHLDSEQFGDPHIDCFQTFSVYPDSQFAHDILIEGNYCDNFGQMFMVEDQSEINGTGNKVHHITFRNNIFYRARAMAINGSHADHFTFVNNVLAEVHYSAIALDDNPYLTVLNNIFYNNGSGSQIIDQDSKIGTVWDYNLHYPDFSWPHKQPEYDQHSLFGIDPRFVNPAAGDFHLRNDSPAIDRGIELAEFNYDKDIVIRPQGAAWDIGAYESLPQVVLSGAPANQAIRLTWTVNVTLPVTSTWQIDYQSQTGTLYTPITGIVSSTRAYTLTGLTNYVWYTVTLNGMLGSASFLADTVRVKPTDVFVYLPLVLRAY